VDSFQVQDNVKVHFTVVPTITAGYPDLEITCQWNTAERVDAGLAALGSAQLTCWGSRLKTLEAVILQLLYRVDFQLALSEFASADRKA
jgi:hypothetical protein